MDKNDDQFESVRKLIALKRYETPGEEYFERFFEEFKDRQRAEIMKTPAHRLMMERFNLWLDGWHGHRWISAAAGAGVAAIVALVFVSQRVQPENVEAQPTQVAAAEIPSPESLLREF
ncbi:MAG: hypothetical protein AAF585_15795 [Verrucomicrobiota bacterium]